MMADELGTGRPFAAAQFGVLGPLQVRVGDESVPLGTPKQRAVLAMLIVNGHPRGRAPRCTPTSPICVG
jgi:hypothetical protein